MVYFPEEIMTHILSYTTDKDILKIKEELKQTNLWYYQELVNKCHKDTLKCLIYHQILINFEGIKKLSRKVIDYPIMNGIVRTDLEYKDYGIYTGDDFCSFYATIGISFQSRDTHRNILIRGDCDKWLKYNVKKMRVYLNVVKMCFEHYRPFIQKKYLKYEKILDKLIHNNNILRINWLNNKKMFFLKYGYNHSY